MYTLNFGSSLLFLTSVFLVSGDPKFCSLHEKGGILFGLEASNLVDEYLPLISPELALSTWFEEMSNKSHSLFASPASDSENIFRQSSFFQECRDDIFFTLNKEKLRLTDLNGYFVLFPSVGSVCREDLNVHKIKGYFENGFLQGLSEIEYNSNPGDVFRGYFRDGVPHGLSQRFRCKLGNCELYSSKKKEIPVFLDEVAEYSHGLKVGPIWKFKIGGGVLFGHIDPQTGNITDVNAVYIYPDNKTALMGEFVNNEMIAASPVSLIGFKRSSCHLPEPSLVPLSGENVILRFEPSNMTHIYSPLLRDHFEDQYIEIGNSLIGTGRGVFAKRAISPGTIVGFYQGVKTSKMEAYKNKELRKSMYKIDNDWAHPNEILDVPEFYRDLKNFNATLCHLINHSPHPNAVFEEIDHPRFGKIRSVRVMEPLEPFEELSVDYGFMDEYLRIKNSYQSILDLGRYFSEASNEADYYQDLKKHINFLRLRVKEIEPYADILKSAGEFIQSALK